MHIEVVKTDFIDIVSACMLSSKSESESICLMVLVISTISYTISVVVMQRSSFQVQRNECFWNFVANYWVVGWKFQIFFNWSEIFPISFIFPE